MSKALIRRFNTFYSSFLQQLESIMPLIPSDKLRLFSECLLVAAGAPAEDAKHVADSLVMGNLTGHDSHGINMLPAYIKRIKIGVIKPGAKVELARDAPAYAMINGNWNFGQIVATYVMEVAIKKASSSGLALVCAFNCNHAGRLGEYCLTAANSGLIAMMMVNSPPSVVPWGGAQRRLGTNPICIAIPRKGEKPILLDMATSIVANGKVSLKVGTGERIPEGWILDPNGKPSTKPEDFDRGGAMLPFGTYKGYGLGLMVDILCGAFTGSGGCNRIPKDGINGVFALVMKPDLFVSGDEFLSSVDEIARHVLNTPLQKGFSEILLPGQPEERAMEKRSREGIFVHDVLLTKLKNAAAEYGVTPP